jgi:hypothetical protein
MPPTLQLSFYPFGVLLRRPTDNGGCAEYAVDPAQVAELLAAKTCLSTGILSPNTILVQVEGLRRTVVEFRPPQRTALFIDGSDTPLRVPLPGLLMIRTVTGTVPKYGIFAVKARPATLETELFQPPLPNIYAEGAVCWGSVSRVSEPALTGADLAEDWKLFLGSTFTPHSVSGKSHSEPHDIRKKLAELEARKARVYPKRDLVSARHTLADVLARSNER